MSLQVSSKYRVEEKEELEKETKTVERVESEKFRMHRSLDQN